MYSSPSYLLGLFALALTVSASPSPDHTKDTTPATRNSLLQKRTVTKSAHLKKRQFDFGSVFGGGDFFRSLFQGQPDFGSRAPTPSNQRQQQQSTGNANDLNGFNGDDFFGNGGFPPRTNGKGSAGGGVRQTRNENPFGGDFGGGFNGGFDGLPSFPGFGKGSGGSSIQASSGKGSSGKGSSSGTGSNGKGTGSSSGEGNTGNSIPSGTITASDTIRDDTDPLMVRTQCQTDGRADNIIGLDGKNFGSIQNGDMPPTCGRRMELYNPKTGKKTVGIALDRIWQNNGVNHGGNHQADVSSRLNRELGGNGKDNIGQIQMRFL